MRSTISSQKSTPSSIFNQTNALEEMSPISERHNRQFHIDKNMVTTHFENRNSIQMKVNVDDSNLTEQYNYNHHTKNSSPSPSHNPYARAPQGEYDIPMSSKRNPFEKKRYKERNPYLTESNWKGDESNLENFHPGNTLNSTTNQDIDTKQAL